MLGSALPAPAERSMIIRAVVVFMATLGSNRSRMAPSQTRKASPLTAVTELVEIVTFSGLVESMFVVDGL